MDYDYSLEDEMQLLDSFAEYEEVRANNGIVFYEPHPKQDRFHRAGNKPRRYVRTGNRFGKSTMGAAEDVAWALGYRPWYPEGDPARYDGIPKKSNKILVIAQDWDKVNEIFTNPEPGQSQGKIFALLPKDSIVGTPAKSKNGVICMVKVKSKWGGVSAIYFDTVKSYMANPMGQESSDWDAIHVDEPCPKEMWVANSRGLVDRNGKAWFTCTPLSQMWINDMFRPKDKKVDLRKTFDVEFSEGDFWMITGEMKDNPTLTPEAIKRFLDDLTPAERQCREKGLPLALSGLVYKEFNYDEHTYDHCPNGWDFVWEPPKNYTIRVAVDPHPETDHAVLFAATAPTGETFFYEEIFEHPLAYQLAEKVNDITYGYEVAIHLMDPAGFIESPTDGSSMATEFAKCGIICAPAVRDLRHGLVCAQQMLGKRIRLPSGETVPKLRFGVHLTRTLWEFDHYEWNPKKPNKPIDKDDHMMENFYRLCVNGLDYIPPEITGGKKIIIPKFDPNSRSIPKFDGAPSRNKPRRKYFSSNSRLFRDSI